MIREAIATFDNSVPVDRRCLPLPGTAPCIGQSFEKMFTQKAALPVQSQQALQHGHGDRECELVRWEMTSHGDVCAADNCLRLVKMFEHGKQLAASWPEWGDNRLVIPGGNDGLPQASVRSAGPGRRER